MMHDEGHGIRGTRTKVDTILIVGKRWFDRINGNTYHSARVYVDDELIAAAPFQYGYGDQYVQSAHEVLTEHGVVPMKRYPNGSTEILWQVCKRLDIRLTYRVTDGLKREVVSWGEWKADDDADT